MTRLATCIFNSDIPDKCKTQILSHNAWAYGFPYLRFKQEFNTNWHTFAIVMSNCALYVTYHTAETLANSTLKFHYELWQI